MTSCHYYFVIQKWIRSSYQCLESTESGSDSSIDNFGKGNRPLSFGNMFDGSAVTFSRFRGSGNVRQTAATRQTILFERCSTAVTIRVVRDHGHVWWHACMFGISHARQFERCYRLTCMFCLQDVSKPDVALLLQSQLASARLYSCMLEFVCPFDGRATPARYKQCRLKIK